MNPFPSLSGIHNISRSEFEQTCLKNVDHVFIGEDTILCKVLSRYKMYVDSRDMGIAPHLIMDGYWESWLTQLLAQLVQPGFTCIDIGANFGYFSILMAELAGSSGRTIAVEPNPRIAALLRSTRFLQGGKFDVEELALSNQSGEAILTVGDRELGGGTIKPNDLEPGRSQVKVQTMSLDELVNERNLKRVDVIKMDVEGVEPLVFEGMQETIASNPGIQIIIEYSPSIYENPRPFTDYLFSQFTVCQVKDVDVIRELDRSDIPRLVSMKDHTDLYLRRK